MTEDRAEEWVETVIRQAIGGDAEAIAWVAAHADTSESVVLVVMAALLERWAGGLEHADEIAVTSRDRQVMAIARSHLAGDRDLVDALARDHLVDHPDSLIVAWVASGAAHPGRAADA